MSIVTFVCYACGAAYLYKPMVCIKPGCESYHFTREWDEELDYQEDEDISND